MISAIKQGLRGIFGMAKKAKEKVFGLPVYRFKTIKVKTEAEFLRRLESGDFVVANEEAMVIGLTPGKEYQVLNIRKATEDLEAAIKVEGGCGYRVAEWFILAIKKRVRVRKALVQVKSHLIKILRDFSKQAYGRVDYKHGEVLKAFENGEKELKDRITELKKKIREHKANRIESKDYSDHSVSRLQSLIDTGLYRGFEFQEKDGIKHFCAYTEEVGEGGYKGFYAVIIKNLNRPCDSDRRVEIKNITPGKDENTVPCSTSHVTARINICLGNTGEGGQRIREAIDHEDWSFVLTMVYEFLQGNGRIND